MPTLRTWVGRATQSGRTALGRGDAQVRRTPSARVRFEQRAAAARRRPWRVFAMVAATVAFVLGLSWVVWASPLLVVDEVLVSGVDGADREAALLAASVPVGEPLARIDSAAIAQRVGSLPVVKRAAVTRSWPRTVVITVTPRVGLLVVRTSSGTLQVLDEDGVAFREVDHAPAGLAIVNGTGDQPAPEGIRAVIEVLRVLPSQHRVAISEITVTSASLVSFTLGEVKVIWGGRGSEDKKVKVLATLLTTKPKVIDVSAPDTPVTR